MASRAPRPRTARRDAAAARRARGPARDPPRVDRAGRDAHRPRGHDRRRRGPRVGRRRLRRQAVRAARARRPRARRAAPPGRRDRRWRRTRYAAAARPARDRSRRADRRPGRHAGRADTNRIRPPRGARPAAGAGRGPGRAPRPRLGVRLPRRLAPGRRRGRPAAREDRGRPGRSPARAHGPRRRLQGRAGRLSPPMRSLRTRLAVTLVLLVTLTVALIGIGVYAFVDASLRSGMVADARRQADFDLSVLLPAVQPPPADAAAFAASGLPEQFRLRGDARVIADFGDGAPWVPPSLEGGLEEVSPALREIVGRGELGYAWQPLAGEPALIVGGRQGSGPALYLAFPARGVEDALAQLRLGLVAGGLVAILVALVVSGLIARGILRPVTAGASAARRIADGDLDARVPTGGPIEMSRWAEDFNRMADSLQATVRRLESAESQNRRFVADV